MSGGTAYVLDLQPERINPEMVDLEGLDGSDEDLVRDLLRRHAEETGSPLAESLVAGWDPSRFIKVMPVDYKRALDARRRAQDEGRDPAAAVMEAARG